MIKSKYIEEIENNKNILEKDRGRFLEKAYQIQQEAINMYQDLDFSRIKEEDLQYVKEYCLGNSYYGTFRLIDGYIRTIMELKQILDSYNIETHQHKKLDSLNGLIRGSINNFHKQEKENDFFIKHSNIIDKDNLEKTFYELKKYDTENLVTYTSLNRFLDIKDFRPKYENVKIKLDNIKEEILQLWNQQEPLLSFVDIVTILENRYYISFKLIKKYLVDELGLKSNYERANLVKKQNEKFQQNNTCLKIKNQTDKAIELSRYGNIETIVEEYNNNYRLFQNIIIENIKQDTGIEISSKQLYNRIHNAENYQKRKSYSQEEFGNILKEIFKDNVIKEDDKTLIFPQEVDFYIPELNIAFEFNGDYWHSDRIMQMNYHMSAAQYHQIKKDKLQQKGITLFYVWESDFKDNKELIYDIIKNRDFTNQHLNRLSLGENSDEE